MVSQQWTEQTNFRKEETRNMQTVGRAEDSILDNYFQAALPSYAEEPQDFHHQFQEEKMGSYKNNMVKNMRNMAI